MKRQVSASAAVAISVAGLVFSMAGLGHAGTTVVERPATSRARVAVKQQPARLVCDKLTVNLGSWCMDRAPEPVPPTEQGLNNYFYASQRCVALGGWLPSAAELIGAAKKVPLESTIHDSSSTSTIDEEPGNGLKDQREMSSTLVTVAAGANAAGSEGVSEGSTGNPQIAEPNPVPAPAIPAPQTLQYVTVYSNGTRGGFAGSEPVSQPENFRCAYDKTLAKTKKAGKGKARTPQVVDEG